ncbi:MAG: hypothetical protein HYV09_29250 [Deltaproteobacteria bacterium]|nr:hypothetical protein [Deltaproteobacteria bacterium]
MHEFTSKGNRTNLPDHWIYTYSDGGLNGFYVSAATGQLVTFASGANVASSNGHNWSKFERVRLPVEIGNGTPYARAQVKSGGVWGSVFAYTFSRSMPAISATAPIDLYGNACLNVTTAWHHRTQFLPSGVRPEWAA